MNYSCWLWGYKLLHNARTRDAVGKGPIRIRTRSTDRASSHFRNQVPLNPSQCMTIASRTYAKPSLIMPMIIVVGLIQSRLAGFSDPTFSSPHLTHDVVPFTKESEPIIQNLLFFICQILPLGTAVLYFER